MTPVHVVLGSFYDEVLRELIAAMGAALFFGNLYALVRRHYDEDRIAARTVERGRPGSPVRSVAKPSAKRELAQAPIARTMAFLVLGFVVMVAGLASLSM
jgi:hypothetical protein